MADEPLSDPTRWDKIVEHYAAVGEAITGPYALDALDGLDLHPGATLLDVAAGTGVLARAAAAHGARVLAIDSSPGMMAYLGERAGREGLATLDARVMDGQALGLPEASFDIACSVFGVFLFPDYRAGLAEMRRVLVPGGAARVVVWSAPDRLAHLRIWEVAIRDLDPDFDAFERPAGWRALMTPEGLTSELARAGFVDIEVQPLQHEWSVASAGWLLAQETDSNPFFERLNERLGPDSRERVRGRLLKNLTEQHGDGPFVLPAEAWLGSARR